MVLTAEQTSQFLEAGYVLLRDCFPRETADEWVERAYVRLGYDPHDPRTWKRSRVHMPATRYHTLKEFAPKAWAAACQLLGGESRVRPSRCIADAFIINFQDGARRAWQPPSPDTPGWHIDGDTFRHFLNSPEQGLVALLFWSDVEPRGGGTFLACDSVPHVARELTAHPEGLLLRDFDFPALAARCRAFVEPTARAGDIALLHPFLLHAASQNRSGRPRFLTNPPIALKRPMRFDRPDPRKLSLVEQAVLRGLGVERLSFLPSAAPERLIPARVHQQRRLSREQAARLRRAK